MLPQTFVAIDVETTGLDAEKDEIIDIALVHFENGNIATSIDFLIKPQKELPSFVNYLTGISQSELNDAKPFKEIAPQILEFIDGKPLVAHNAAFDSKLFTLALSRNGFKNNEFVFWDSLAIAQAAWTYESHKLVNLVKMLNIDVSASHRALPDAEACGKVFLRGLEELEKSSDLAKENLEKAAMGTAYEPLFKRGTNA
jgi:ATP-dependent DNA helicase DinG